MSFYTEEDVKNIQTAANFFIGLGIVFGIGIGLAAGLLLGFYIWA